MIHLVMLGCGHFHEAHYPEPPIVGWTGFCPTCLDFRRVVDFVRLDA